MQPSEDIKKYFKYQHKEIGPRQHVSKEQEKHMLKASMVVEHEYSETDLEFIKYSLKQFDLNMKFGPLSGLGRLERWKRAHDLNLSPPIEIKAFLEDDQLKKLWPNIDKHLWAGVIDVENVRGLE